MLAGLLSDLFFVSVFLFINCTKSSSRDLAWFWYDVQAKCQLEIWGRGEEPEQYISK